MPKDVAQGFIPDLLALMPLSAREVLIAGSGDLAKAYRRRNPNARLTGVGPVAGAGFRPFRDRRSRHCGQGAAGGGAGL